MRVLIQGDSHGRKQDILPKIYKAGDLKISHVLVTGDFGLWTHRADGQEFLDEVNEAARINNLAVYAVGGNHENWDHWNWYVENHPQAKGFGMVRRRVLLAPKVHKWKWANKTFIGAGGAVSVDKGWRVAAEQGRFVDENGYRHPASGNRTLWWPNEELTDKDVLAVKGLGKADFLITHDCSNYTHFGQRLKPDADSERHRWRIDKVIQSTEPKFHFHGHMHEKYDWVNAQSHGYSAFSDDEWTGPETRTIGLEAFTDFNSWGVLDVDTETWLWPREVERERAEREARKAAEEAMSADEIAEYRANKKAVREAAESIPV